MQLSKQPFWDELRVPQNWAERPTSRLLGAGGFCYFRDPSVPFYLPLGQLVLDGVRTVINDHARECGLSQISLPTIFQDTLLETGQEVEAGFKEKMMVLGGDMKGYHLLFTPEPIIDDLLAAQLLSHRQLPIRFCYHVDMFRNVADARGMLKTRQFQTFVGNTIEPDDEAVAHSLQLFESLTLAIFDQLGITVKTCRERKGMAFELFYMANEGESLFIPELDPDKRITALSLAMAYHYCPTGQLSARFQGRDNKKHRILLTTYAIGVQRLFYTVFDAHRDALGFRLPKRVRPADVVLVPKTEADVARSLQLQARLRALGQRVLIDDRCQISLGARAAFADYIGAPWKWKIDGETLSLTSRDRAQSIEESEGVLLDVICQDSEELTDVMVSGTR
jgi:prolyl-tRNA synthetase